MKKIKVIRQYILWEYLKLTNFYSKLFLYLFSWSILLNNPSKKLKLTTLTLNLHKQILIYEIIWISWTFLLKINTELKSWNIYFINPALNNKIQSNLLKNTDLLLKINKIQTIVLKFLPKACFLKKLQIKRL